jgi:hypothetical protein
MNRKTRLLRCQNVRVICSVVRSAPTRGCGMVRSHSLMGVHFPYTLTYNMLSFSFPKPGVSRPAPSWGTRDPFE